MDQTVINSILELTRARDVESLDHGFVSALAASLPIHAISLYKRPERNQPGFIEESVRLVLPGDGTDTAYEIVSMRTMVPMDKHMEACMKSESAFAFNPGNGSVGLLIPLIKDGKAAGLLGLEGEQSLLDEQKLVEIFSEIYGNYWTVLDESERDKLTGLFNRRTYDRKLHKLLQNQKDDQEKLKDSAVPEQRQRKTGPNAWLATLDIDNFKTINDTHGHLFGDEVILMLSQKMKAAFRRTDLLFRFGGDEFVIILEPIPADMARQTLERFRQTVVNHKFPQIGNIAVSIGFAKITENDFPQTVLNRADKALYYAKEQGKNRIFSYQELLDSGIYKDETKTGSTELF